MSFEVVTLGEAMLRLSVPEGVRLEQSHKLDLDVAGAEVNTAIALAQMGRRVTWLSRLPDNQLGKRVARELRGGGVDYSHVKWVPDGRLGLYFVEMATAPRPVTVVYDRQGSVASEMTLEDFPVSVIESARVVHLTGITPALSESCRQLASQVAELARNGACLFTFDINYRSKLWPPAAARESLVELAKGADLVVITREDARDVFGLDGQPEQVLAEARQLLGAESLVLTLGEKGSMWTSGEGPSTVEAISTEVVDRLGAGDAFMAGAIDGLLEHDLDRGVQLGTALAALTLGIRGDHVITSRQEVERMLSGGGRTVDR